ncbi:MAG TPA: hypothetical protein VMS21_00325, partial [Methylomirabilota bacterium]|nr:hypothetical protein [Methylomirabilota bacterium]
MRHLIEKHGIELIQRDHLLEKQRRWDELMAASKKFSYDAIRAEAREIRRRMREGDVDAASEEPVSFDSVRSDAAIRKHALRQAANAISAECPRILAETAKSIEAIARKEHAAIAAIERGVAESFGAEFKPSPTLENLEMLTWSPSMVC